MKIFELVDVVLTNTYAEIPGDDAQKDAAITATLLAMSRTYGSLKVNVGPSYASPQARFGYIFTYVTCFSNLVPVYIARCPQLRALFEQEILTVTCLGGGPGSDVIGVLEHMESREKNPRVLFNICDREVNWADSWSDIGLRLGSEAWVQSSYLSHDATDPASWKPQNYLKADLFTMLYFMSELFSIRAKAEPYFDHVFSRAKQGALFLYIDNRDTDFSDWFDKLAGRNGLAILDSGDETRWMPGKEQMSTLAHWSAKFANRNPKLTANISFRVAQKT